MSLQDIITDVAEGWLKGRGTLGCAIGITLGPRLIHFSGYGTISTRPGSAQRPTERHVFRIASMTKSFVAAATLLLRDRGLLDLDVSIHQNYVPELQSTAPPLTLRMLLSMSGGLPTDDPWADRMESMDPTAFVDLLRQGLRYAHRPGTRYEYSNLGFALVGFVVSRVAGCPVTEFIHREFLVPLGMLSTSFSREGIPDFETVVCPGHSDRDGLTWLEEDFSGPPGVFSAIGGIYSCVKDLAVWVGGFTDVEGTEGHHPLSASSRREMQQGHRVIPPSSKIVFNNSSAAFVEGVVDSYGFGLHSEHDAVWGNIVGHSGGYPGYGSHMRWHTASGYGVIVLGNTRYAKAKIQAKKILRHVLQCFQVDALEIDVWPETRSAAQKVRRLLASWDDTIADALFAVNVYMDETRERRKTRIERAKGLLGGLREGAMATCIRTWSAAECSWHEPCVKGYLAICILLTPHGSPKVQTFTVKAVVTAPEEIEEAAQQYLTGERASPSSGFDPALRSAMALDGPLQWTGEMCSPQGPRSYRWRVAGRHGGWFLDVEMQSEVLCERDRHGVGAITGCTLSMEPLQECNRYSCGGFVL